MFQLPADIIQKIFEYDPTFRDTYKLCIKNIPSATESFQIMKYLNPNNGWVNPTTGERFVDIYVRIGKYNGEKLSDLVSKNDVEYLIWAVNNKIDLCKLRTFSKRWVKQPMSYPLFLYLVNMIKYMYYFKMNEISFRGNTKVQKYRMYSYLPDWFKYQYNYIDGVFYFEDNDDFDEFYDSDSDEFYDSD